MAKFREAQIWEDGLRTDPNKKSYEWWYFDVTLDNGSTFVVTFFTKQPQNTGAKFIPQIQAVYTTSDGVKHKFTRSYATSEFSASTEKCDVVLGPNTATGDLKKYLVQINLPEISVSLVFERVAPSYSTTERRDEKTAYFGWFPAIPFGKVEAQIKYEGKETNVKGTGYHDHNWGTIDMKNVCDYWYWGRGSAGDYHIFYSVMYLPKLLGGKHASIFYLAKKDELIIGKSDNLELVKTDIVPPKPSADRLPTRLSFAFTDVGQRVDFTLKNPKLIESADPYQGESVVRKILAHLFSKPRYVRYNADLEIEIDTLEVKDIKAGKSLYEIMILH